MSATLVILQNEKADATHLLNNTYTMVQVNGDHALNAISLRLGLIKLGHKVLKVNSVQLPPKKKIRGGKNKVVIKRAKKFLVKLPKGEILKNDELLTLN